jgi:hypothetical protein
MIYTRSLRLLIARVGEGEVARIRPPTAWTVACGLRAGERDVAVVYLTRRAEKGLALGFRPYLDVSWQKFVWPVVQLQPPESWNV